MEAAQKQAGWYEDPYVPGMSRYWDGEQWGEQREENERAPRERPTGKANRVAILALIFACSSQSHRRRVGHRVRHCRAG